MLTKEVLAITFLGCFGDVGEVTFYRMFFYKTFRECYMKTNEEEHSVSNTWKMFLGCYQGLSSQNIFSTTCHVIC